MKYKNKFRLLHEFDTIKKGDYFLEDDCKTWTKLQQKNRFPVGAPYKPSFYQPMKRKIKNEK